MFACSFCHDEVVNRTLLIHHYRLSHPLLHTFNCEVKDCRRTFSTLAAFGRHLRIKHDNSENVANNDSSKAASEDTSVTESSFTNKRSRLVSLPKPVAHSNISSPSQKRVSKQSIPKKLKSRKPELKSMAEVKQPGQSSRASKKNLNSNQIGYMFAAKLHSYPDIPRLRIVEIINDVDKLIADTVETIRTDILRATKKSSIETDVLEKIESIFSKFNSPLSNLKTEWQCLQKFRDLGTYVEPVHYSLGERDEYINKNGLQIIKKVRVTAQFIPMRNVFQKLFELPNIFDETVSYINSLKENKLIISNFVQGSLWQEISSEFQQETVFPLFMHFDDYERNNPLGSHKGIAKCGAVYLSIPRLPPKYQSKLQNIFLFILFNTLDREIFRNISIFNKAIEELKFLKTNGVTIQHQNFPKKIRFALSLILGDNLGLHSLFGLVTSFKSTFFCRFCLMENKNLCTVFEERQCTLRNESNYQKQLLMNDFSQTGIKEPCIFHDIPNFHITKNLSVDVMHDVLEGIGQYDLGLLFHYYIFKAKLISLSELNDKVRDFFYGHDSSTNKPPAILESHIKNKRLIMSSSEMLCLIRHLSSILGLKIPQGDKHWDLIVQLKRIVEMVVSTCYHAGWENLFTVMISEYLETLTRFFPGCIKPKHHFLVHHPRVMAAVGPLWKISLIRFESKHQEGKRLDLGTRLAALMFVGLLQ